MGGHSRQRTTRDRLTGPSGPRSMRCRGGACWSPGRRPRRFSHLTSGSWCGARTRPLRRSHHRHGSIVPTPGGSGASSRGVECGGQRGRGAPAEPPRTRVPARRAVPVGSCSAPVVTSDYSGRRTSTNKPEPVGSWVAPLSTRVLATRARRPRQVGSAGGDAAVGRRRRRTRMRHPGRHGGGNRRAPSGDTVEGQRFRDGTSAQLCGDPCGCRQWGSVRRQAVRAVAERPADGGQPASVRCGTPPTGRLVPRLLPAAVRGATRTGVRSAACTRWPVACREHTPRTQSMCRQPNSACGPGMSPGGPRGGRLGNRRRAVGRVPAPPVMSPVVTCRTDAPSPGSGGDAARSAQAGAARRTDVRRGSCSRDHGS